MTSWYSLKNDRICPVQAVPGLYICGQIPASSTDTLSTEGITHILSILQDRELLRRKQPQDKWEPFKIKQIAIDDQDTEDILIHLDEVYNWIEAALATPSTNNDDEASINPHKVLIHCRQGISRSGSFVIAYLMKKFSLSYSTALQLARESRNVITPNSGFEQQLRIYEHCKYDIYLPTRPLSPAPVSTPGPDKVDRQLGAAAEGSTTAEVERKPKAAYTVWKKERDIRAANGEHLGRFSDMANMAAAFGRRRLEAQMREKEKETARSSGDDVEGETQRNAESETGLGKKESKKRQQQWRRVEEMERAWNDKLIKGEVERAKENGDLSSLLSEVFDSVKNDS